MRNKNWRLHHAERIRNKTEKWLKNSHSHLSSDLFNKAVSIRSKTPCICSGHCCGNPRKWFCEPTIQERKAEEDFRNQLDDLK